MLEKLSVPISIVIAGGLVAGALYYSSTKTPVQVAPVAPPTTGTISMRKVTADDHILGNPNADVVIVEYSDTECPYCKQFHTTMQRLMSEYGSTGKVAWVYRHFPIDKLHPKARKEAEALECANELGGVSKFWEYTNMVYDMTTSNNSLDDGVYNLPKDPPKNPDGSFAYSQKAPRSKTDAGQLSNIAKAVGLDVTTFESCLASGKYATKVQADYEDAVAVGGQGTPHSILITKDGMKTAVQGARPYESMKATIDALLQS